MSRSCPLVDAGGTGPTMDARPCCADVMIAAMHAPWMLAIALAASCLAAPRALAAAASSASPVERPLIVPAGDANIEALDRAAPSRGLDVARPQREPDVAAESALADVRPLYRDMAFA